MLAGLLLTVSACLALVPAAPSDSALAKLNATSLDRSAYQLAVDTHANLANVQRLREAVLAVEGARTVENTYTLIDRMTGVLGTAANECGLFSEVHPDQAVKEVARQAEREISALATELSLDADLYAALAAIPLDGLDEATRYAIEKDLRDYRRSGVDQSEEVRAKVSELNKQLTLIGQEFSRNISDDVRELHFSGDDVLTGLPDSYIAGHPANDDGTITINTTYPDYVPFMTYAVREDLRRAMHAEYANRAYPQNLEVLDRLIATRHELATLLGYPNWAAYVTEDKMIGSAEAAQTFLDKIAVAGRAAAERDLGMLLAAKRAVHPEATTIEEWEKSYWNNKVLETVYAFDARDALPYFAYERVREGLFDLCTQLFGVSFEQVEGLELWHEDVSAWDMSDENGLVGRFYLDMHPRPESGKYGHAACFPYREGLADVQYPQATLVCNFPNPAADGLGLMEFGQVNTFFHEFGHLIHHLFAGTGRWSRNAGISNEWDFVEAPSQILEEWLVDPRVLQSFALHHETNEPIPTAMVDKIRASSEFGKGSGTAQQLFYAALSLNCYDQDPDALDTTALVKEMQAKYSPHPYVDGTHFQCNFGHLNGYSAIYYTYKWSEVIAKDMFSRFEVEGVLNPDTARDFRAKVLGPGGSKPAAQLVEEFLGRPSSFEAFQRWLEGEGTDA
ncbi:MAG: oligopeptidase A [Planctomycetota bacterium]|nr:MAG: oligopeptidase A [Planctomycetota bacterium]